MAPQILLYLIADATPNKTRQDITERLLRTFDTTLLRPWHLDHRLFRSSNSRNPKPEGSNDDTKGQSEWRYLHLLQMNLERDNIDTDWTSSAFARVCFSEAPSPTGAEKTGAATSEGVNEQKTSVIAIPTAQLAEYGNLLGGKMGALWTPWGAVSVTNGSSFAIGGEEGYVVRIGELRQKGLNQGIRGVVVCIEGVESGKAGDSEVDYEVEMMRLVWKQLGVNGAKEFASTATAQGDENEYVRQWCELLRLRG